MKLIRHRKRRNQRRGAAVTELAICLPLLLLLVLGIVEWGSVMFVRNNMLHAAREGCRAYAVRDVGHDGAIAVTQNRLTGMNYNFTVTASPENSTADERWVEITTTYDDIAMGDPLKLFTNKNDMTIRVTMRRED